jgi:hypothetical protein
MSVDLEYRSAETEPLTYRAVSRAAVVSFALGLLSIVAILDWSLVAIPLVGILLGLYAVAQVRSRGDELTGLILAKAATALSLFFLVAGLSWLSYSYATEVPPGYMRVSYDELQPDQNQPQQPIPSSAIDLDGKNIFIKGFVYPGRQTTDIQEFLLVRDKGDCCFGGNPKITDRIQVTLSDPLRLTFSSRLHHVAGKFHVRPTQTPAGSGGVYYYLEADYLQ